MDRYHLIDDAFGGSDVYDSDGNLVGYALPSIVGDGDDFFDMNGTAVGQSFYDQSGRADFIGLGNDSYGFIDRKMMMGKDAWLSGDPFSNTESTDDSDRSDK